MSVLSRVFGRRYSPAHPSCENCDRLGRLWHDEDVGGLIEFLGTANGHTAEAAAALARVTGKRFGTDPTVWKSWWRKQKALAAR
jgi:hypothetical protein